jgi:hypothetical protein
MDSEIAVQYVQACIREGRFVVSNHARDKHPTREGFTVGQGIDALMRGEVLRDYSERNRLLFCGEGKGLRQDKRFCTTYIHVVVEVDTDADIVVVTMYRPSVDEWRTAWKRR